MRIQHNSNLIKSRSSQSEWEIQPDGPWWMKPRNLFKADRFAASVATRNFLTVDISPVLFVKLREPRVDTSRQINEINK